MFGKKKKIRKYLIEKDPALYTPFDYVLQDYLSKALKQNLKEIGLAKIEIHLDWLLGYEGVCIQAIDESYVNIHIYPNELNISCTIDEPDECDEITYEHATGKDWIYQKIRSYVKEEKSKFD